MLRRKRPREEVSFQTRMKDTMSRRGSRICQRGRRTLARMQLEPITGVWDRSPSGVQGAPGGVSEAKLP